MLSLAWPANSAVTDQQRQKVYQILKSGVHHTVLALPKGEREILLGLLELERDNSSEAIAILSSSSVQGDPVASMLRAEAYRRQSVQAAIRAGRYAHAVDDDIDRLKQAKISAGIDEAEQRLQMLVEEMNRPQVAEPVEVAAITEVEEEESAYIESDEETIEEASEEVVQTSDEAKPTLLDGVKQAIESWRKDWQSRDAEAYLSHYDPHFSNDKHDYASWAKYKTRINRSKSYITVNISNLKIVKGPEMGDEGETVVVTFRQKYASNNHKANSRKQLYLTRQSASDAWKILSEGNVGSKPPVRRIITTPVTTDMATVTASDKSIEIPTASTPTKWAINVAAFDTLANAEQMAESILMAGKQQPFISTIQISNRSIHRVRIGMYASKGDAVDAMMQICPQLDVGDCWLENLPRD